MSIETHLKQVLQHIIAAEQHFARQPGSVALLAVTKAQPAEKILAAAAAGQRDFAESYLQEALSKIIHLQKCFADLNWHFIGALQSNKLKAVAAHFAWVHSVTKFAQAETLSRLRSPLVPPLNICVQLKLDAEPAKAGVAKEKLPELMQAIARLPHLKLRGLMVIPAPRTEFSEQRNAFHQVQEIYRQLQSAGFALDTLSMGMSNDYTAAIAEGATLVRIGSAIFGAR